MVMPIWRKWPIEELRQAHREIASELARRCSETPPPPDTFKGTLSQRIRFMACITAGGEIGNLTHLSAKLFEAARDAEELESRAAGK